MVLSLAGISGLLLAIAIALKIKKLAPRVVVYLMLLVGIAGLGGILGALILRITNSGVQGASGTTSQLTGVSLGGLIATAVMTIFLWPHIKPKGQPPTKYTWVIALLYGGVLSATGGVFAQLVSKSQDFIATGTNTGLQAVVAFFQGL